MAPKKSDVKILKGQEAEEKVLEYLRRMNRPFGAVDVSSNLKGAVPKAATQKILLALAEKGEVTQKLYGKTTFFVINQAKIDNLPAQKLGELEAENKSIEEENKLLAAELKSATAELARLKSMPTDSDLGVQVKDTAAAIEKILKHLEPLRSGSALISASDVTQLDSDWKKWRHEWIRRRNIFTTFWHMATDTLAPQAASELAEDLGIEYDTTEHEQLERTYLCKQHSHERK